MAVSLLEIREISIHRRDAEIAEKTESGMVLRQVEMERRATIQCKCILVFILSAISASLR